MERGSSKHGPALDDELKDEARPVERAAKESRVEDEREMEEAEGHRVSGSGSSADLYPHQDLGETGGEGHPEPKHPDDRTRRDRKS